MSEIKLQVGKTYISREGKKVKIVENGGKGNWRYRGNNSKWYTEGGDWDVCGAGNPEDLIEELPETRHTFDIPDGVKEITLDYFGNRIVVEMVPEKGPKPGDVMVNAQGNVYIFKGVDDDGDHVYFAWIGISGLLSIGASCRPGRPATPEEAQPLWDALKKARKRWNPETMQVEDVPEFDRILEWVEANIKDGYYNHEDVAEVIEAYLKHKEGEKCTNTNI